MHYSQTHKLFPHFAITVTITAALYIKKDGKAAGGDGIPAEVWKHGGDRLHQLITNALEVGSVP